MNKKRLSGTDILIIGVIILIGIIIHYFLGNFEKRLEIYPDEFRYYGIARSLYLGKGLTLRGAETSFQKITYSILLAPFFAIKDTVFRIKMINLFNCVIMTSSGIPIWFIGKELELNRKQKVILTVMGILWPETLATMTFMSEVVYWPLFFWFVYLWIRRECRQRYLDTIVASILCYIGYLTKEIFLAIFLTSIVFDFTWDAYTYLKRRQVDKKRIISTVIFVGFFVMLHLLAKSILFSGLGNSYNQMDISAIEMPYNFMYLFYAFFYYFAAILIAMFIIPFAYPMAQFEYMQKTGKKVFVFMSVFFVLASATIAYTISVREDLGRVAPRIHFRYIAPGFIIMLAILLNCINTDKSLKSEIRELLNRRLLLSIIGGCIYVSVLFKGVNRGTPVDQFSLEWYLKSVDRLGSLAPPDGNGQIFNIGVIAINVLIVILLLLYYRLKKYKLTYAMFFYFTILICVCLVDEKCEYKNIKNATSADRDVLTQITRINDYLCKIDDGTTSVVYFTDATNINGASKYMDTYMDWSGKLYYVDDTYCQELENASNHKVEDLTLRESIFDTPYLNLDKVDYIIVENENFPKTLQWKNCSKIQEASGNIYSVYRNNNPDILEVEPNETYYYTGDDMTIWFTGDQYNALTYAKTGISGKENGFSWTDGDKLEIRIPSIMQTGEVDVEIEVVGTFNGAKGYIISGTDNAASGELNGSGKIAFTANIVDHLISFDLNCVDAQQISSVTNSMDARKVAFQIEKIQIKPSLTIPK